MDDWGATSPDALKAFVSSNGFPKPQSIQCSTGAWPEELLWMTKTQGNGTSALNSLGYEVRTRNASREFELFSFHDDSNSMVHG